MPSIRSFASRVPEPLLREFLELHSVRLESHKGRSGHLAQQIEAALAQRGPGARASLVRDIEVIDRMASENGQVALADVTMKEELVGLNSAHARALSLFLRDRGRFRQAEDILYADNHRYGKQWNAFVGPRGAELRHDREALEAFKAALREAFDTPNVHIEFVERSRLESPVDEIDGDGGPAALTQITIYREELPNAEHAFEDGALTVKIRAPVAEAAIIYDPVAGMIECVSAHRATREDVVRSFGTTLLGSDTDFELRPAPVYDLTVLHQRCDFPREPDDGIEDVSVRMLRLQPVASNGKRITVEALHPKGSDIWTVVDECLGPDSLVSDYRIDQAKLVVRYRSDESNRSRSLPITITHPHRSNIKEQREIERIIANKYLPRWGLVVEA